MFSYSVWFFKKKLFKTEAFSGILFNLPKQKLARVKSNKLIKKTYMNFNNLGPFS